MLDGWDTQYALFYSEALSVEKMDESEQPTMTQVCMQHFYQTLNGLSSNLFVCLFIYCFVMSWLSMCRHHYLYIINFVSYCLEF